MGNKALLGTSGGVYAYAGIALTGAPKAFRKAAKMEPLQVIPTGYITRHICRMLSFKIKRALSYMRNSYINGAYTYA